MGATPSEPRIYAKFEGEAKPEETKVLRRVIDILKPGESTTMLEEIT